SPTEAWGTPIYHAFALYRRCASRGITCTCTCPTFDTHAFGTIPALEGVLWLDAAATLSEDGGEIALSVVNRHPSHDIEARVEAGGTVVGEERAVLTGGDERAATRAAMPDAVAVEVGGLDVAGECFTARFPAHSATVLRLRREVGRPGEPAC
ncbi:MAG: alpha-L-arabinofuranosidase C-terminal domain-containing protein, partial [Armatimonadota bacterium]